jgi:preprotein translocase subunit SecD
VKYLTVVLLLAGGLIGALACAGGGSSTKLRLTLEPQPASGQDVSAGDVVAALQKRLDAYGVKGKISKAGSNFVVDLSSDVERSAAVKDLTTVGLLEFCEPVTDSGGNVAVAQQGTVQYQPGTCEPARDASGNVVVDGGSIIYVPLSGDTDRGAIVWQPAKGDLNGTQTALTSQFMTKANVETNQITELPVLIFSFSKDGSQLSQQITGRLAATRSPLAPFIDGQPIRGDNGAIFAPTVQSQITDSGQITGLGSAEAQDLARLFSAGPLPVALRIVPNQ